MKINSNRSNAFDSIGVAAALLTASGWSLAGIFIRLKQIGLELKPSKIG